MQEDRYPEIALRELFSLHSSGSLAKYGWLSCFVDTFLNPIGEGEAPDLRSLSGLLQRSEELTQKFRSHCKNNDLEKCGGSHSLVIYPRLDFRAESGSLHLSVK